MKKIINLNETDLQKLIKESVEKVLKEQLEPIDAYDFAPYFLKKIQGMSIEKLWPMVMNNLINSDCLFMMQNILEELNIDWQKDVYGDDEEGEEDYDDWQELEPWDNEEHQIEDIDYEEIE